MGKTVLLTAHSGADNRPDNSLEFVDYALRSDADALECAAIRKAFLRWDTTPPEPPPPRFGIRSFAWRSILR